MGLDIHIPENVPADIAAIIEDFARTHDSTAIMVAEHVAEAFQGNDVEDSYEYALSAADSIREAAYVMQGRIADCRAGRLDPRFPESKVKNTETGE